MNRQARKNTNLVENLKEINWWFDNTYRIQTKNLLNMTHKIPYSCLRGDNPICPNRQMKCGILRNPCDFSLVGITI